MAGLITPLLSCRGRCSYPRMAFASFVCNMESLLSWFSDLTSTAHQGRSSSSVGLAFLYPLFEENGAASWPFEPLVKPHISVQLTSELSREGRKISQSPAPSHLCWPWRPKRPNGKSKYFLARRQNRLHHAQKHNPSDRETEGNVQGTASFRTHLRFSMPELSALTQNPGVETRLGGNPLAAD